MAINDTLADMLTRIRNAQMRNKNYVSCYKSKMLMSVLDVMQEEGFIEKYQTQKVAKNIEKIVIKLRYYDKKPVIKEVRRLSKPGRRVYANIRTMPRFYNGLGVTVISTSKGITSAAKAIEKRAGGEVLCEIF